MFAVRPIPKNRRIVQYRGELISSRESLRREERYLARGEIWCFRLTQRRAVDAAVGGNIARFINHSCRPNCYAHIANGSVWIRAARNIRPGEELTYNYYTDGEGTIPCRCRQECTNKL